MPLKDINLQELRAIDFTKTDLADIKQEIIDFITNHPTYSKTWDNFYDSDSGKMILDTFAYLVKKLIVRTDLIANEAYPATAQQEGSVIKVLKLIGYNLRSYTQAASFVNVEFNQGRPATEIVLGVEYGIEANDLEGALVTFYLRKEGPFDYFNLVKVPLDVDGKAKEGLILKGYSGVLTIDNIDRSDLVTVDGEIYTLNESPVVQDSVRVFYIDASGDRIEAVQTDSFFNVPTEADYIPFIVHFDEFRGAYVEFGDSDLVQVLPDMRDLQLYYCVGGGASHNITENSINITDNFATPSLTGNVSTEITLTNPGKGFGGKDPETIEQAKRTAPLSLKAINRSVTEEDYAILLQQQGSILFSQILSPNDNREYFPADSEIPLFHVFIYATLNKPVDSMDDLLITKQVDEVGNLIGGDAFDILDFLRTKRIIGIENVLKPTIYTRVFFDIDIVYNKLVDLNAIQADIATEMGDLYTLENTGYWQTVRLTDVVTNLKSVNGVLDVTVTKLRRKTYSQLIDTVSSQTYFRYDNAEPEFIEVKNSDTDLPMNYETTFDEVAFMLDITNDSTFSYEAIDVR